MAQEEKLVGSAVEKLRFINSPLHPELTPKSSSLSIPGVPGQIERTVTERALDEIRLVHNDDATNLEIFYDLFLACINLFSQNQQLTTLKGLSAYCGFFGIIWTTWFMTGMYDVRFLKDSIFERCARGVHLGVLVGFVVVSPNFDTQDQDPVVFKVFTIILMASRLCLALEYGSVLYHLREFPGARFPVGSLVVKNAVAAIIYLGVAFRFREGHDSNIFSVWYILAGFEIIGAVYLSYRYRFLSFQGTYIMKRMGLLTCILFGEGVASACSSITKVIKVEDHVDVWTSQTIGTVTACISLVYIVYMVYSDWVSKVQLPGWRQMTWVIIHFPLHLSMMLFMEGCSQFIVFWKLAEKTLYMQDELLPRVAALVEEPDNAGMFAKGIRDFVNDFITKFPPVYTFIYEALEKALTDLDNLDLSALLLRLGGYATEEEANKDKDFRTLMGSMESILLSLDNTLYGKYGIDFTEDVTGKEQLSDNNVGNVQNAINQRSYGRFRVAFQYTFVTAGFFLALANVLSIISRTKKWTWSATIYHSIIFLLAMGISLVAAVSQNEEYLGEYQVTPWILPTLLLTYMLILTMNHVSGWLAAKRDKKASRKAAGMGDEQYHSGDSSTFVQGGLPYAPVAMDKGPGYSYAPAEEGGAFSVPRRPVPYSAASYATPNAV